MGRTSHSAKWDVSGTGNQRVERGGHCTAAHFLPTASCNRILRARGGIEVLAEIEKVAFVHIPARERVRGRREAGGSLKADSDVSFPVESDQQAMS